MNKILLPCSIGELFDKISILEIKIKYITDPTKKINIQRELMELIEIRKTIKSTNAEDVLYFKLSEINQILWNVENKIRNKENEKNFDLEFIELAKMVYKNNDIRSKIKRQINENLGSYIIEEKFYNIGEDK